MKVLAILLCAASGIGCTQSRQPLRQRIPNAEPAKYRQVRDGKDWKNPYLVVRRDGVEIIGVTSAEPAVPVDLVEGELERLPRSAWPYGLVVAVQDVGIMGAGDQPRVLANREKLLAVLKRAGIAVELWPSA